MITLFHYMFKALAACSGSNTGTGACVGMSVVRCVELFKAGCAVLVYGASRLHKLSVSRQLMKVLFIYMYATSAYAITPPGTIITNTASADFDIGGTTITINSNPATTVSTIISQSSSIALYQHDPSGSGTGLISLPVPTQYSTTATPPGTFVVSPDPAIPQFGGGSTTLDPNTPIDMIPVDSYHTGEPVFTLVTDPDQNLDPGVQETVIVIVTSSTGDREEILLTETGVNTGEFIGYVQSAQGAVTQFDGVLALGQDTNVTVTYIDQFDGSDVSVMSTLVDPFGIVFDSSNGNPVDGVQVTILDSAGNPAIVYGDDGIPGYPNVVTTGGSVTFNGTTYNFPSGGYRFPILVPGNYRMVVSVPVNFTAPSVIAEADLQVLPGAPFAIDANASYGNQFAVPAGPPLRVDIPIDPLNSLLVLNKRVSTTQAAVGDFVRYTLELENRDTVATAVTPVITDILPLGVRYQVGSVRIDGVHNPSDEPQISSDGRTLSFILNDIAPLAAPVSISYVTELTAGVHLGKAVNTASAVDNGGNASNTASASITVIDDLFSTKGFIAGRVIYGECDADEKTMPGMQDIKIYLEDGTSVVTDENGNYHFEAVNAGSHVVQVDLQTISDQYEIVQCENNTRFAKTPYSQFVDIKGGTLWRANFFVRNKPPVIDSSSIEVNSELIGDDVKYMIHMENGSIPVENYRLIVSLPEGIDYVVNTSMLDKNEIADPYINDQILVFRLENEGSNWQHDLEFRARLKVSDTKDLETSTVVLLDTDEKKNVRSQPVISRVSVNAGLIENRKIVFQALFKPMSAELSSENQAQLDELIAGLGNVDMVLEKVVGHSDNVPIRSTKGPYTSNKSLSKARAESVAAYLVNKLGVSANTVDVIGMGAADPVVSNRTAKGRAQNRRVEIFVKSSKVIDEGGVEVIEGKDQSSTLEIMGRPEQIDKYALTGIPEQKDLHIEMFDAFWLKTAETGTEWLMPQPQYYAEIPSVNIAIKHAPNANFEMRLNGEVMNPLFYFGTLSNQSKTVARSYWQGVHLRKGVNKIDFVLKDSKNEEVERLTREVVYAGQAVRAELEKDYSRLLADGTHTPVLALRFYDVDGNYARPGTAGTFEVNTPYLPQQLIDATQHNRLTGLEHAQPQYSIGAEGIALIELEPTTEAGKVILNLPMSDGYESEVSAWLRPELRDWVMVGLAEGTLGYNKLSGNLEKFTDDDLDDEFYADGRVAFFAKGIVKGEWLLTTSFDSDRGRFESDNRVNQLIDPDTYYTIYGDATRQKYEASSAEKLYIKIEKQKFYAVYGDISTDLDDTELSAYSRNMTGLKSEYEHERFSLEGFAAENLNNFVKDEIPGNGTSGLYQLSGADLVINSEKIRLETRDRFRSEVILESKELTRHVDYSIDYQDGTIFFRQPIASKDTALNPIIIVADYEVESPVKGSITGGGRAAVKLMDDKLEVGVSAIHDGTFANESDLIGADAKLKISKETTVKLEVAATDGESTGAPVSGSAYIAEVEHEGDRLSGRVYLREQEEQFGLGQQSGTQSGTSKYGAEGEYVLGNGLKLDAEAYHEEVLSTNAERDVFSTNITYTENKYSLSAGARMARDLDGAGQQLDSDLLLLGASRQMFDNRVQVRANAEIAVNDNDANPDYPSRYLLGADYFITPAINIFAENEWTMGQNQDTQISRMGVHATPWSSAEVVTTVNREVQENGIRSFATLGLIQGFKLSERWSADIAFDRTETMRDPGAVPFNSNVAIAQGTTNNDFTAVSIGATYRADTYTLANRLEQRNAEREHKTGVVVNWERNIIDGIGYSLKTELFDVNRSNNADALDGDIRFSLGYRPLASDWIVLNKLEYKLDEETDLIEGATRQHKLVENFVTNYKPDHENQLSVNYGLKYVQNSFDGIDYDGITQLLGGEYRHDLSKDTDFGLHAHTHYSHNSGVTQYSFGGSFGWNLARNIWISFGYNIDGFDDPDFSTAGYTSHGPYMKFRLKFDQDTAKEIQRWLN